MDFEPIDSDNIDDVKDVVTEAQEFDDFMKLVSGEGSAPSNDVDEDEDDLPAIPSDEEDEDTDVDEEDAEDEDADEDEDEDEVDDDEEDDEDEVEEEDPVDVDYDTLITLPNGEQLTIEDLHSGYKGTKELIEDREAFEDERTAFEEQTKDLADKLDLAKLEADRVLDDFKDFDWQKLAMDDPKEFANTKLFVEKYAQRAQEIRTAKEALDAQRDSEKQAEIETKAAECVKVLQESIPNWNKDMYADVIEHAVSLGMPKEEALNTVDPAVIKALVNSMKMSTGTKAVKAKVTKRVKSPKKVTTSGSKNRATPKKSGKANYNSEAGEFDFFKRFL